MNTYVKRTFCPYDCPTSCGFLVETDGEKILKVMEDKEHPAAGGLLCRKMRRYERSVHSRERIQTPLIRTGAKGEGSFREAGWEEAVTLIAGRWKEIIREHGPEAVVWCGYSGVMSDVQRNCVEAFFNYMGACDLVKTLCSSAKGAGYESVVGTTGCLDPRELKDSDYYLVWGNNMEATRIQTLPDLIEARKNGKKVVLVEVYSEDMKKYCDDVLLIRPGTDGALALAMMHVIDRDGLTDENYLKENAVGYEEFKKTLPACTPEWAEKVTGIPASSIEKLAREYGTAKAPAVILGSGPSRYGNGAMTTRLIMILTHFVGAWAKKGGGYCGSNPTGQPYVDKELIKRSDFRRKPAGRSVNINQLGPAVCDSETKSLYVYGSNPANSVSDSGAVIRGLSREDLFTVVHERFMTDTARYADVILPATFSVEQPDIYEAYGYCTLACARKIIDPPGACKSNWDTVCALAAAMGYEDEYFKRTEDEMVDYILDHPTEAVRNLPESERRKLREGGCISIPYADHTKWATPTGKIQIVDPAMPEPLPRYTESYGGDYPLRLISIPSVHTLNSIFSERPDMTEKRGRPRLVINREDAGERGIREGDQVVCWNDLAEVVFEAHVTDDMARGAVGGIGVYGSGHALNGLGINALQHARISDAGEATTMNDNAVDVRLAFAGISERRPGLWRECT